MGIENAKRWHWIVIGGIVGMALGYMNAQAEPGMNMRSMSGAEFESELIRHEVPGDQPNLRHVVVHPAREGAYNKPVYVVTMERAVFDRQEKGWRYEPYALEAEVPYVSYAAGRSKRNQAPAAKIDPNRTVLTALKDLSTQHAEAKYSYAWWEEPKWVYTFWGAGAVFVIGGVWPIVLSLMSGAGLGVSRKPKEAEYDLDRFQSSEGESKSPTAEPEKKEMSAEEKDAFDAQLTRLQTSLGTDHVLTDVPPGQTVQPATSGPIRQLNGGPLEQVAAAAEEEDKDYKGEFYPVARPTTPK